jgi:hypothetical protein
VRVEVRTDGDAPAVRTARNAVHQRILHQWLQRKRGHERIITRGQLPLDRQAIGKPYLFNGQIAAG